MAVDNARLPPEVEIGAVGGPLFKTSVLPAASGDEQRIGEWDIARGEWDIGYGINNKVTLLKVISFHRAVMGKLFSWRFKDWSDFEATDENFGTGDGSTVLFQLKKTYSSLSDGGSPVRSYVRNIIMPRSSPLTIKDNGATVDPGNYTLQAGGKILFSTAPITAHALTWTGEFDVAARFDTDKINASMQQADFGTIRGIRVVEVLDAV